jgi:predicted regulator of Ras-like GTPase activity (Roadblock/LC7/MglB family)
MLRRILEEFLSLDTISSAAIVGRDGFVVEIASSQPTDLDALGAFSSSAMRFYEKGGESMDMGPPTQLYLEYMGGALHITPVTRDEFLVIQTCEKVITGELTSILEKTGARVVSAM